MMDGMKIGAMSKTDKAIKLKHIIPTKMECNPRNQLHPRPSMRMEFL